MNVTRRLQLLQDVPLFSQFEEPELRLLLRSAILRSYAQDALIIKENDVGDEFFLVLEGRVEVRKGREALAILGAGQFFGEMAFFDRTVRSADVVALEETQCIVLNEALLHSLILTHPEMAIKMMAELARRLRNTDQESFAALEQRVADRTRELSALYEVTAVASEALDLDATLKRLLERSLEAMNAQMGAIHLLDEQHQTIRLAVHQGVPQQVIDEVECMQQGAGFGDWIVQRREPLLVPDITKHPCMAHTAVSRMCPQAFLGVPMRAKGKVLGVLCAFREAQWPFNAEDVALLASIGDQVGVVVENARLRQQAEAAAVMEERGRLARDLHDSVTQSLYSVTLFAEAIRRFMADGNGRQTQDYLDQLSETAQQALKEVRLLVYELRPSLLQQEGLVGALQQRLNTVEKRANVQAQLVEEGQLRLKKHVEVSLYHIAQEALNNSLKHAAASAVTVRIRGMQDRVELEVCDDGKGFDPATIGKGGGVGMVSMRERIEKLGGSLQIISAPGQGTRICVQVGLH